MLSALKKHWPEYLMEAAGLGIFMVSASVLTILLYHPASPALKILPEEFPRRVFTGLAMGLTAIGIIYSPWGKQSGAHLNPAVTLTFFRLGKVAPWDAAFYLIARPSVRQLRCHVARFERTRRGVFRRGRHRVHPDVRRAGRL